MKFNTLTNVSFMITDRCTAACPICCSSCSPKGNRWLDPELIKRYMREAKEVGEIDSFSFSGGEPLIDPDYLYDLVKYAWEELGIYSTAVSNGFWAKDYERGKALMEKMKAAGLHTVRLSADPYHQQFVSAQTLRQAIRILVECGIKTHVTIMVTKGKKEFIDTIRLLRPEIYLTSCVCYPLLLTEKVKENPVVTLTDEDVVSRYPLDKMTCANWTEGAIHFNFDGYVYHCCSQHSMDIPQMRLGKMGETSIKEMLERKYRGPLLDLIRRESIGWLAEQAKKRGVPVKESYTTPCELCYDLTQNGPFMEAVMPEVLKEVERLRAESLMNHLLEL